LGKIALSRDSSNEALPKSSTSTTPEKLQLGQEPCAGIRDMDNWFESRGGRATIIKTKKIWFKLGVDGPP